ncbi:hypothetical protein JCM10207_009071 [Rhodosporidiobolus poonsookiae]
MAFPPRSANRTILPTANAHGSASATTATQNEGPQRTPRPQRPRRKRSRRTIVRSWQAASFHLTIGVTLAAIALVWAITPLSWAYVLWTAFSQLGPASGRPAPPGTPLAFTVLHYLCLAYTSCEVLFSVYYRYLAIRAQKLREAPRHTRKFLRGLILRALENGLRVEEELEDEQHEAEDEKQVKRKRGRRRGKNQVLSEAEWEKQARDEEEAARGSDAEASPVQRIKRRMPKQGGDGAVTPELRTTDLPGGEGGDYLSARVLPTLRIDSPTMQQVSSRASLDSRDEGYGGDALGAGSVSRISVNTLDSAIAVSPYLRTAGPQLPRPFSVSSIKLSSKQKHPYHPHLKVALSPSDPRAVDFRELFRHWFGDKTEFSEIHKLNVADWFAWSLYGEPLEKLEHERKEWDKAGRPALYCADGVTLDTDSDLEDDGDGEGDESAEETRAEEHRRRRLPALEGDKLGLVQHCVALVEARAAHRFPAGRNPRVKATRLTLDPVRVTSRPLLLYGVVALLQQSVIARAKARGFREEVDGETRYLVYVPEGWEPKTDPQECERPLVFIHGLGMGACQYATLISVLSTHPSIRTRPVLILLQPHISMSFFQRGYLDPPDQKRCTEGLERVLRKFRFDERAGGCTVLSHSNGTIVHGWLVKDCPSLVARSCFVDPVTFCLWEPWVCHNFLVRVPRLPIEHLMRYFVSRELGVALMLSRTFQWTSNLLFPSHIPAVSSPHRTAIFLSSEDSILNAERMRLYLRRNGLTEVKAPERVGERAGGGGLKVFRGIKHGESMVGEGAPFDEIFNWVQWDGRYETAYTSEEEGGTSTAGNESA